MPALSLGVLSYKRKAGENHLFQLQIACARFWRFALVAVSYLQLHPCYASCMLTWGKNFLIFRPWKTIYIFFRKKVTKAIKSLELFNRIISYKTFFFLGWRKNIWKEKFWCLTSVRIFSETKEYFRVFSIFQPKNSVFQKLVTPNTHQTLCVSCFETGQKVAKAQYLSYFKSPLARNCLVLRLCFYCTWWSDYVNESHTV